MQIIISPAKTLDFDSVPGSDKQSRAAFLEESCELIDQLKLLSPEQISQLMKISPKLGELNYERFQSWQFPFAENSSKQCIFAFKGDVYTGLDAETLTPEDIHFSQQHLNILSGLYGLLKPLDQILPYRLEMGTRLKNDKGKNLYEFWGEKLTERLNNKLEKDQDKTLINLASNEYSKAIKMKAIKADIITPNFKDKKNGEYKLISFYAKKARGLMSRYIIQNQLTDAEALKDFDLDGYTFNPALSQQGDWVYTRTQ